MSRGIDKKNNKQKIIYLDNNGTTFMPQIVKDVMISAMDQGNPSGTYMIAQKSRNIIDRTKEYLLDICGVTGDEYVVVFTSGASESNNYIFRIIAESYKFVTGEIPHIITSSIEHKTSILCAKYLSDTGIAQITFIDPTPQGEIDPVQIEKAIKPNTCLISIIHGNNETGVINDVEKIGKIAHDHKIPFHSDVVQTFGKMRINPNKYNIDAMSVSFHKLYGPTGIGALILKKALIKGYGLCALICGSQNDGLRGGTESAFLVAGALAALKYNFEDRDEKNKRLTSLKKRVLQKLKESNKISMITWAPGITLQRGLNIIVFGNINKTLVNTILMAFVYIDKLDKPHTFCNIKLQDKLNDKKVIVGIGSACNKGAGSHVLEAMQVPQLLRTSVVRVSFGDNNTEESIDEFITILRQILSESILEIEKIRI